ncbi:hypothetical protein VNI00_003979 [Paramarasmius palmivorus]|uniref:Uncharacterized protein n=1 Tax=Paramarasmius palmivorus TaxID=297713 RepID=A0AAW0DNT6_9AGAR
MAKNNGKKASQGKPITDWFSKKPRTANSSFSSTTDPSSNSQPKSQSHSLDSPSSSCEASSSMGSGRKRKATSQPEADVQVAESSQRTPAALSTRSITNAPAPPTPLSPKENLIHHSPSQSRLDSRKKPRLSSPDPIPTDCETVPPSQSDEMEIGLPLRPPQKVDRQAITHTVSKWREETGPAAELVEGYPETSMNVDPEPLPDAMDEDEPSSPLFTPNTSYSLFGTEPDRSFGASPVHPLTPPMSGPESPALSPVILDSDAKTAKIIAEIRAKAYAKIQSSPEDEKKIEFREELDDSDDDELLLNFGSIKKGKQKETEVATASTSKQTISPANNRYNLRQPGARKASAPKSISPLQSTSAATKRNRKSSHNPLDALLKEKKKADKAGKGDDAFQRAERAVAGRSNMRSEMDDEEDDGYLMDDDWLGDENRARKALQDSRNKLESSPERDLLDDDDFDMSEDEAKRLFEDDARGKAVADMIAVDKKRREVDSKLERRVGHPLWTVVPEDAMALDFEPSNLNFLNLGQYPILRTLKAALEEQNSKRASLLLKTGAFTVALLRDNPDLVSCLCNRALGSPKDDLTQAAFYFLLGSWNGSNPQAPWLPFDTVVDLLAKLGADVRSFGWNSKSIPRPINGAERESCLLRLVQLVTAAAQTRKIFAHDASDVLLALCAVSSDPSTSPVLRTEIMLAVNAVCFATGEEHTISASQESSICSKLLTFISRLAPVNKAHVVSLFAGGSGRAMRMARWIAYSIILKRVSVPEKEYSEIPPLDSVLSSLSPSGPKADLFRIDPDTDYVDMRFYVDILAVALSNIPRYVAVDTRIAAEAKAIAIEKGNKSPSKGEMPTPLVQRIQMAVEEIHSKIVDTRGAHLDRSRAKAALKNLSMRVYYQRQAAVKSSGPKPKNIAQYFGKKKT